MINYKYKVFGMHCTDCTDKILKTVSTLPNTKKTKIDIATNTLTITSPNPINLEELNQELQKEDKNFRLELVGEEKAEIFEHSRDRLVIFLTIAVILICLLAGLLVLTF